MGRTGKHWAGVETKCEEPRTPYLRVSAIRGFYWGSEVTFGPSLMRIEGMASRSMEVVFHQLGAPSRDIFSSVLSLLTRSGMEAVRKGWDIIGVGEEKGWGLLSVGESRARGYFGNAARVI